MTSLQQLIPDVETLLAMEPAELAGVALEQLVSVKNNRGRTHRYAFCSQAEAVFQGNAPGQADELIHRLAEAWSWLEAHGMIAEEPDAGQSGWFFVTRLGRQFGSRVRLTAYRKAGELPLERLHPRIAERCHALYIRGEFDSAIFEAYKALEVEIRDMAQLPPGLIGVKLARKAFAPNDGPLTDNEAEPGEQQALCDLMAGALGSYKNPHSHRRVKVTPEEAVEMIIVASHLLGIACARGSLLLV